MKFGAHMSTAGGVWKALERGRGIGCDVVQLFVKNNMQWLGKPHAPEDLARYVQAFNHAQLHAVFGHTGYLINIAAPDSENRAKSIKSLVQEIRFAEALGLPFLVLHPGAHLGAGEDEGLKNAAEGLDEVFAATKDSPVRVALENTAGQGTCLGHDLKHLISIYGRTRLRERLAICLDTAHFFEAGYDIRQLSVWNDAMDEIRSGVGLEQIVAFHLNDSKTPLGSRVDRHAGIGQGAIGIEAFGHIVNDARFLGHPGCLETPKSEDLHEDVENLRILRSLGPKS